LSDLEFATHSQVVRAEESLKLAQKERDREAKKNTREMQRYIDEN
jgi:hypothetical protein